MEYEKKSAPTLKPLLSLFLCEIQNAFQACIDLTARVFEILRGTSYKRIARPCSYIKSNVHTFCNGHTCTLI